MLVIDDLGEATVERAGALAAREHAAVRAAGAEDLETVARLALVEIKHRSAPPMFAPPYAPPLGDGPGRMVQGTRGPAALRCQRPPLEPVLGRPQQPLAPV